MVGAGIVCGKSGTELVEISSSIVFVPISKFSNESNEEKK